MGNDTQLTVRSAKLSWRELDGQIVVLDVQQSTYLTITGAGVVIWQALVAGASIDQIVEQLLDVFDVDRQTAQSDTETFLAELRDRDLLT